MIVLLLIIWLSIITLATLIHLVCIRDMKADTNGARLLGHQSAFSSLREFCSCWQTEVLSENVRLQGTNLNADGKVTLCQSTFTSSWYIKAKQTARLGKSSCTAKQKWCITRKDSIWLKGGRNANSEYQHLHYERGNYTKQFAFVFPTSE